MCSLRCLTYLQVQVLPRQWMVGPSSHSRPWFGGDLDRGKLCRKRAGESVAQAAGKDWSAALANMQAATLREDCRPEIASFSEASEGGVSEPPNPYRKGEGSHNRGISHQANSVSRRGRGRGMHEPIV